METTIERSGERWMQNPMGKWFRWNESTTMWEDVPAGAPPPPAPPPPANPVVQDAVPYQGPAEGSAAWKAEQVATGQQQIATRPASHAPTGAPSRARVKVPFSLMGALRTIRHVRLVIVAVSVITGAAGGSWAIGGGSDGPSQEDIATVFAPLTGFEYAPVDDLVRQGIQDNLDSTPLLQENVSGWDAQNVTRGGKPTAVAFVMGVDPDVIGDVDVRDYMSVMSGGIGMQMTPVDLGGIEALEGSDGTLAMVTFYDRDGMFVYVAGANLQPAREIAQQLAIANT